MDFDKNLTFQSILPSEKYLRDELQRLLDVTVIGKEVLVLIEKILKYVFEDDYEHSELSCEELLDYAWEMLNSGNWKTVSVMWRIVYSFATLLKIISLLRQNATWDPKVVCGLCDLALLMGDDKILDGVFHKLAVLCKPLSETSKRCDEGNQSRTVAKKVQLLSVDETELLEQRIQNAIAVSTCPTLKRFQFYMTDKSPVVLERCIDHWPALFKWSFSYLKSVAGHRTVPVEVGSKYTDDDWSQKLMTISDFIDTFVDSSCARGYLAQHALFDQIPDLKEDIRVPDYCCISDRDDFDPEDVEINAWFGPKGTVSPCHHDAKHNLLAQVVGRKYIRLYAPEHSASLYPHESGSSILTNTSQVDLENPDFDKFPLFKSIEKLAAEEHILRPGQLLYIPPKYWHYVRSLDESFSVSFWWD